LVGVTVSFEYANDFHVDLEAADWLRFMKDMLKVPAGEDLVEFFKHYLEKSDTIFAFESDLAAMIIPFTLFFF
jgi:hypothetical protein